MDDITLHIPDRAQESALASRMALELVEFFWKYNDMEALRNACTDRTLHKHLMACMIGIADDIVSNTEDEIRKRLTENK